MYAWQLEEFGLDNLRLAERPTPEPGPGEILVKVSAVSLNYRDKAIVDGVYDPDKMPKNLIPVNDAAGVVAGVGPGVTEWQIGDRVMSHFYAHWLDGAPARDEPDWCLGGPRDGGLAEYMILEAASAVPTPANLTDEQASTLPIAALTAWFSLLNYANIQTGQSVVIQGTGGVSLFAVQIASALGAHVIATSSSDEKLRKVAELGATDLINYRTTPNWEEQVRKLTNGDGADLVIDVVGGEGLNQSVHATRAGGHIALVGFLGGQIAPLDVLPMLFSQATIRGIAVGHRRAFLDMNAFIEQHGLQPVIDTVYAFSDAHEAYHHLARGAFGKIVIRVAE
ncbi:alcohol dehydrogenase [Mycobacteroides abscessus subsp. bolletii]|uniref:zinc-dependent alcohol dehydrogenase family protein n=1 Tax=Mycobacteroides abscessus TaxID=36809 RepID=UPI0009A8FAD5|nr:NAD(P)-dependent alcohol dehydrogenase [Mycobacteroides abscessus]SKG70870.1 alcohol dehydrogenase [Mycobacteroides abscessus subsp. bolletii]SKH11728.1 alcohol dehydrogenase [Mycobacteroides abscessus subsp. bolletii]